MNQVKKCLKIVGGDIHKAISAFLFEQFASKYGKKEQLYSIPT
jgi:hypothetical protein